MLLFSIDALFYKIVLLKELNVINKMSHTKDLPVYPMQKYIYFHICTLGDFPGIITNIMNTLQNSGILHEVDKVRYIVVGNSASTVHEIMTKYTNTECLGTYTSCELYERVTLHRLRSDCQQMTKPAHILYLHSKGVSKTDHAMTQMIDRWVQSMLEGLLMYRYLCWRCLETGADVVGSFLLSGFRLDTGELMPNHFSGNFWWATSSHVARLPNIGEKYHDPEMWIIGNQPNVRIVVIDNFAGRFKPYVNIPSIAEYRSNVSFIGLESLSKIRLSWAEVESVEMGFKDTWLQCSLPSLPRQQNVWCLSLDTLGISTHQDIQYGLCNIVKIIRIHLRNGHTVYCKENECVEMYPRQLDTILPSWSHLMQGKKALEIGGPSQRFVPMGIYTAPHTTDNINFSETTLWNEQTALQSYTFDGKTNQGTVFISDGTDLRFIEDATYDIVFNSHVMEHMVNPLKALFEWNRILKSGGLIICVLPWKETTFDHRRPITSFDRLLQFYHENRPEGYVMDLLPEILETYDLSRDLPAGNVHQFTERCRHNDKNRALHIHVFDFSLITQCLEFASFRILDMKLVSPFDQIVLAQKE